MEIVSWIGWLLAALAGWVWSIAWLLVGGWVSTLLQILIVVFLVFAFKYGWAARAVGDGAQGAAACGVAVALGDGARAASRQRLRSSGGRARGPHHPRQGAG